MTNANTEIDLDELHQAIIDKIAAQFPAVQTVADYREDNRTALPIPAVLVELADFEGNPDEDPGTEQLPVLARFEARVIIGFRTPTAQREIRRLSAALCAFIHQQRWGLPVGPAEVLVAGPDEFDADLDQYVVWRFEWQQALHLGASVWTNDGAIPTEVLTSWAPEIGEGNVDEYEPQVGGGLE